MTNTAQNHNDQIVEEVGDEAMTIYRTALMFLQDWKFESNLQFPKLVEDVAKKLNITDDSEKKELDAQIRFFVRRNPTYKAKRGAHGGIALASAEAQREAAKNARLAAKAEASAKIDAQVAAAQAATTTESDSNESDETEIA